MPSPAPGQMNVGAALQALQKQVDQLTRRPAPAGGGSAPPTGYVKYEFNFAAGAIVSTNVYLDATSVTTVSNVGATGVTALTTTGILYGEGVYVITADYNLDPTTNAVTSDIHHVDFGNHDSRVLVGSQFQQHRITVPHVLEPADGSGIFIPRLKIYCPAGTNRSYALLHNLIAVTLIRWDLPT